jgi:hypothetical protein
MSRDINETDWKLLRELFPIALERLCGRVLEEVQHIDTDASKSAHQRYLDIYELMQRRDKEIARAFNDLRRSTALIRLVTILSQRLLTPDEFARFSPETQSFVEMLDRRPA